MKPLPVGHHLSYRQQYIKCGKSPCKTCDAGQGYGPYWYFWYYDHGKLVTGYAGKRKPVE